MKALLLNGSTRKDGCAYLALSEVVKALNAEGWRLRSFRWAAVPPGSSGK